MTGQGHGSRVTGHGKTESHGAIRPPWRVCRCAPRISLFTVYCSLFTVLLFCAATAHAGPLDAIKKRYSELSTVEARFQQKIYILALKRERDFKGEFYYKRSKGFLWKYTAPTPKIFLYDGKAIWQAEEEKPFVIRERVDKEKMQGSFLDLVEDIARIDEVFTLGQETTEDETAVLELLPKKEGTVRSAKVWISKDQFVKKMEIAEITGNVNTITFSSIKANKPLDDSLFLFKPGQKEVVER